MPVSAASGGAPAGLDQVVAKVESLGIHPGWTLTLPSGAEGVFTASVYPDDLALQRVIHLDRYTGEVLFDLPLAGLGALLPHPGSACGEISSLYTLTRFMGAGVGGYLVSFAVEYAGESGFEYVFACTTSPTVVAFFERHGFREVGPDEIPAEKWSGYPEERRARVHCMRRDL